MHIFVRYSIEASLAIDLTLSNSFSDVRKYSINVALLKHQLNTLGSVKDVSNKLHRSYSRVHLADTVMCNF